MSIIVGPAVGGNKGSTTEITIGGTKIIAKGTEIVIIGAGVIALTIAAELQAAGNRVRLYTRETPLQTTSSKAAAFWMPFHCEPAALAAVWGQVGYERFRALTDNADAGVVATRATILCEEPTPDPDWAVYVDNFSRRDPDELPAPYVAAYEFDTFMIDMPRYLRWLTTKVIAAGATITIRTITSLAEVLTETDLVIICAGLGARCVGRFEYPFESGIALT